MSARSSILDTKSVSQTCGCFAISQLDIEIVGEIYGTGHPSREMVEGQMDFFDQLERGMGIYIILYEDGRPHEILFAGYSFD
jgi:hypothetical protein